MIEQKQYDIVFGALQLACEELSKSNIEITEDNKDLMKYKVHDALVGYYLIKADKLLKESNK